MFVDVYGDSSRINIAWLTRNFLHCRWLLFWLSPKHLVEGKHATSKNCPGHAVLTTHSLKVGLNGFNWSDVVYFAWLVALAHC
jgi:hypothetical protein